MSRLEVQAETIKLARLLGVPESRLQGYSHLDAVSLRAIRESASAAIFDDARPMLVRVAAASKLLPVSLIAMVAEKIFGTMLCARTVGLIAPQRALEVTLKLPDAFLADASSQIDPRSVKELIAGIPVARVKTIAAQLIQRRDYVTMGRFVDYVPRETIRSVIESIRDNAVLLHVAFYVENKSRLNDIMDLLPESRLREIVRLAGGAHSEMWPEALALMNQVSPQWRGRIGDLTAAEDTNFLTGLLRRTQETDLWDALLPVIGCMSVASRRKLAQIPALADAEVLQGIIHSAHANDLWAELLPLVSFMGVDARKAAAQVVEHLPQKVLVGLIEAASAENLWPDLIGILSDMDETEKRLIVGLIGEQDDSILKQLLVAVHAEDLWGQVLPLVAYMGKPARKTAARVVPGLSEDVLQRLLTTADALNLWSDLIGILVDMDKSEQQQVVGLILLQTDDVLGALLEASHSQSLWADLLPLLHDLADADLHRLARLLPQRADLQELEAQAVRLGLWHRMEIPLRERFVGV